MTQNRLLMPTLKSVWLTSRTNYCVSVKLANIAWIERATNRILFDFSLFWNLLKADPRIAFLSTVIEFLVLFQFNLSIKCLLCWTLSAGCPDPDRISLNVPLDKQTSRLRQNARDYHRFWLQKVLDESTFLTIKNWISTNKAQSLVTGDLLTNEFLEKFLPLSLLQV